MSESNGVARPVAVESLESRRLFAHVVVIVPEAADTAMQAERSPHTNVVLGDGSVRFGRVQVQN